MTGSNELKVFDSEVKGEVFIRRNSQYNNLNADKVVVFEGVIARIFGNIKNVIIIKKNSKVYIHGSITGKIENEGGEIILYK